MILQQTDFIESKSNDITRKILFTRSKKKEFSKMSHDDKLQIIHDRIGDLKDDVKVIREDLEDIKKNLYHPDDGVYARITKTDSKVVSHQAKFTKMEKVIYTLLGAVLTSGIGLIIKLVFGV